MNGDAERAMVTGIVVTYARSVAKSRQSSLGAITGRLATPESLALRPLHAELLNRRNDLFAHNDATPWRGSTVGLAGVHVEDWESVEPTVYRHIERLAIEQRERFQARLELVEQELGRLPAYRADD